jgi:erythritol kinase
VSSIGIDVGTSVVKAVRFGPDGSVEASSSLPTAVSRPRTGWSEQDPLLLWEAVRSVVADVASGQVDLVAVTAMGDGCWLVDADGQPARDAVLWNDSRAAEVVDRWERAGLLHDVFAVTGSYGNSGLATPILSWLAENEPAVIAGADTLVSAGSWVWLRLTGRRALHVSDACNPLLDAVSGTYDLELLERLGLGWAGRLLPDVVSGIDAVAAILPDVATQLGLPAGTPVALGPYDVVASVLGIGAVSVGSGFGILGTTLCVGAVSAGPARDRVPAGMSLSTGWPGRWLLAYGTLAGTGVLDWAARLLGVPSAADLVALATTSTTEQPPLVLPYLSPAGERAPFRDAAARGAVLGLTMEHTAADVARGVVDGLSLAVKDCLVASGESPETLAVCGGGSRSAAWCQSLADATRAIVRTADQDEVGARGAVLSGLISAERRPDVDAAVAELSWGRTFRPRSAEAQRFDASYERFVAARTTGATRA